MNRQLEMFSREPELSRGALILRTYIYLWKDGKCVHVNAGYGFVGREYEHDDPNWQPPEDWPYEVIDQRKSG